MEQYLHEISTNSRPTLELLLHCLGVGVGVGVGLGVGGGVAKPIDSRVTLESGNGAGKKVENIAAAAFEDLGFGAPFGHPLFRETYLRNYLRYMSGDPEYLTDAMETTIEECLAAGTGIPPQFFEAKHQVEKQDAALARQKHHKAPL